MFPIEEENKLKNVKKSTKVIVEEKPFFADKAQQNFYLNKEDKSS